MKKIYHAALIILILVITLSVMRMPVFAEEKMDTIKTNSIIDVINKQGDKDELLESINTYKQNGNMFEYDIADKVVLRAMFDPVWACGDLVEITDSSEIMSCIETTENHGRFEKDKGYVVLDEIPVVVGSYIENGEFIVELGSRTYEAVPTFIQDIQNDFVIRSDEDIYSRIISFDATNSYNGITVYYIKENGGGTVLYYEDYESEAYEFDFVSFQSYLKAYYEYKFSYENTHNENGEPLNGRNLPFTEFVKMNPNDLFVSEKQENKNTYFVAGAIICILVAAIIIGAVVVIRYKKGKTEAKK